jgi:exonuclease SbcC
MSKIKKIEISDFRIYEGTQEFNFETDNGISNLVALYAPNGFGKTSFFDAIEWSFSNEIKRFENNFIRKAIKDEQEDTILLTNTNSYKKSLKGKVKIVTDKDLFLEKQVQKYKKPGTPFYNDYRQGVLIPGAMTLDLSDIPETNILTQDQIDAFLRFKTPEEKFATLKEFWPQSEEATNRLKQISELHKVVLNNLNEAESKIKKYGDDLESLAKDNNRIDQINSSLQKLIEQKSYECNITIEKIDDTISQKNYDLIYDENSRNIKGIALEIDKEEKIRSQLVFLYEELSNYLLSIDEIKTLEEKLLQLQSRKSNFLKLKKSKDIEKLKLDDIKYLKLIIERYKYVDSHRLIYIADLKKIEDFKEEEKLLLNEETKLLDHIQTIKESVSKLKRYEKKCFQERLDKEKHYSEIDKKYNDLKLYNSKLAEQKKQIPILNLEISNQELEIRKNQKRKQIFDEIIEKEDCLNIILFENKKSKEFCSDLKKTTELAAKLNSQISSKQIELNKLGTLNENLDKIILFGEDYITKTNSSDCPLCKSPFDSFEDLIKRIKLDKKDTLMLSQQKEEISNLSNELTELLKTRTDLIKKIKDVIEIEKEEISSKLVQLQGNKNILVNKLNDIDSLIRNLVYEVKIIIDFFTTLIKHTEDIDEVKVDSIKKELEQEITSLLLKENRVKIIIGIKEDILFKKENKLLSDQSKLDKNEISVKLIQTQEIYQKVTDILIESQIDKSKLEGTTIEEIVKTEDINLLSKEKEVLIISKDLKLLEELILKDKMQIDEANLEGKIFENDQLKRSFKENKEAYKIKFNNYIASEEITKKIIQIHQLKNQKTLQDLLIVKKDLEVFGIDLELIKENIRQNELEKEIQLLNEKLPKLIKSSKKIEAAKRDCMNFVQSGINNYFNKDVINEVYSRIEPHPKLTKIDFSTDFNDKGEPRLLITTGNDEGKVNPILFLSAGQINVLSLSIFLAKAFEYGNETIETIFMDDPIQNLSDINVLSFIDLLRTLISTHDKQIVISTHDEKFFRLLQNKLPEEYCNSKYFEFESEGKLKKSIDK